MSIVSFLLILPTFRHSYFKTADMASNEHPLRNLVGMAFKWAIANAHQCSVLMDKSQFEIGRPLLVYQICLKTFEDTLLFMKKLGTVVAIDYLPLKRDWLKRAVPLYFLPSLSLMHSLLVFSLHGQDNSNPHQLVVVLATRNLLCSAYFSSLLATDVSDFQQYS